uniref:Protein NipSnap homolog 3A-like n=1 Tax=Saccoglossus kowalevskii TaxID=10224 RepID=A0ABM0ME40_SACKO
MAMSTCRYLHRPMRTVWASSQTVSRCFTTEDNGFSNKWYELRTYKIQPAKLQDFMKLSIDKINLRFNHSKGIGYWMADIGGLNEAVHIWEYDNFAHRTKVRKQMSEDPSWNAEYLSKMLPMLVNQESVALK